jgi:hypothetical protein
MSEPAPQVFSGITPDHYAQLTQKARDAGIELAGNSGTASKFGVEVAYTYTPESQQLTLHCLKTPFFVSLADVEAKLQALVEQSLATS